MSNQNHLILFSFGKRERDTGGGYIILGDNPAELYIVLRDLILMDIFK